MGGGKETPRQKMIGLMYLVLMALLAMNVSKEIINAFVTLNNKLESSISNVESFNDNISNSLAKKYSTLEATSGKENPETRRVKKLVIVNDSIISATRFMCNDLVKRNLYLLISAADASTQLEDFDGIEEAVLSENPESVAKLKALVEKVKGLGIIQIEKHGDDHAEHADPSAHDPYHNDLFHIDHEGFIHIKDLSGYTKKDDYDTPTRLLAGPSFEEVAPEGQHLMDNLHHFRNEIVHLLADHDGEIQVKENGVTLSKKVKYHIDTSANFIPEPDFLNSEQDKLDFAELVSKRIDSLADLNQIDYRDKETIKNIWVRMTIQKSVMNHGETYPWIFGQFDHAPIVAASAVMTSLRSDVLSVQTLASQLIDDRVKVNTFDFNKIEPLAFSKTSYINQGDSVGLKVMIAAYDSTEAMKLRYWEDDSTEFVKAHGDREMSSMLVFNGRAGDELKLSGSVGDHVLYGEIAVKEKGAEKWKPWHFNYSVGSPNAAIANNDLLVLYGGGWKNKIKVSASGYKPESIKLTGSGCSISGPDKDGMYIAKVADVRKKIAVLTVSATDDNGTTVKLATEEFRLFRLPPPQAFFGGLKKGAISRLAAQTVPVLVAKLEDNPLNCPYEVKSYKVKCLLADPPWDLPSNGRKVGKKIQAKIKKTPKGLPITFYKIKVAGPNGKPIDIMPINLTLK